MLSTNERLEIMELLRAGKFYDHPQGPIGLLDIGSGRLALLGKHLLNRIRFSNLEQIASRLTEGHPDWDDSACVVDEYAEGRFVRAPDTMSGQWVSAAGEIEVRDGLLVAAATRFAEHVIADPATDEEIQAMMDTVHAKLGLLWE
jgi:hypothetical protein